MDRPTEEQGEPPHPPGRPRLGPAGPDRDSRRQFVALGLGAAGLVALGVLFGALSEDPSPQLGDGSATPAAPATSRPAGTPEAGD